MNGICSGTDDDDGDGDGEGGSSGAADVSQLFLFFSFFSFSFFFFGVDDLVVFSPIYTSREDLCLCVIVNVIVTSHQLTFTDGVELDFSLAKCFHICLRDDSIESERET